MFQKLLISLFLTGFFLPTHAQEIIRHFDPADLTYVYPLTYEKMVGRFELPGAVEIKKIAIYLDGSQGSSCKVGMYGHEGGTSFPQFENALFEPIQVTKETDNVERIEINLPSPIELLNNQCFVYIEAMSGVRLMSSILMREASCSSSSGGDYYFQFNKSSAGQWGVGIRKAYGMELIVDFIEKDANLLRDVTSQVGIDTNLSNATMAWADWNKDGLQDLLVAGRLFTQIDSSTTYFRNETSDVHSGGNARANAFVDLDLDGDLDIYLVDNTGNSYAYEQTKNGWQEHALGLPNLQRISSFSFGDVNNDGAPDLFVSQLWAAYPVPMPNYLFVNNGDFSFADETSAIYPDHQGAYNYSSAVLCEAGNQNTWLSGGNRNRRSRGSEWVDFDLDGDLDLYVTNYFLETDEFYRNDGGLTFTPIINNTGIDKNRTGSNHGTGVDWADYDNDGDPDLLLPQFAHPAFSVQYDHRATTVYNNVGSTFEDTYPDNGIQFEETYAGGSWGDVNNDGLLDFFITVFYGCRYVKLYIQQPDHTFRLSTFKYGLAWVNTGQDVTWVDFNNDGRLDLSSGKNGRIRLYQNNDRNVGRSFSLKLIANEGQTTIGSKVQIRTAEGSQYRVVTSGHGLRMQDPYIMHFGTGDQPVIEEITVEWADGSKESAGPFRVNAAGESGSHSPIEWAQGDPPRDALFGDSEENPIAIFPNPSGSGDMQFYITANGPAEVVVCDVTGRILERAQVPIPSGKDSTVAYQLSRELASGTYIIYVAGQQNKSRRFVIDSE